MLSVLLAFLGALIYGGSDFFGGRAATRMSSIRVTAINSVAGVAILLVASLFIGGHWNGGVWLWGLLAGLAGAAALGLLYACLAVGPMSILAPIMALVSAVVPIGVGFASGERLSMIGYIGLVVGLLAIVLICFVPDVRAIRPSNRGIAMAAGAGLAVGLYLVFIDRTPHDSGITPLIISFSVGGVVMGTILLVQRIRASRMRTRMPAAVSFASRAGDFDPTFVSTPSAASSPSTASEPTFRADSLSDSVPTRWWRTAVALAAYSGLTDATACVLFLVALRLGDLSVVSVLDALSPAGTIVLAAIILKERIAPVQWAGLVVALTAAAMLALA
jgi:drug/metabolite transporter (DMT)-like permease